MRILVLVLAALFCGGGVFAWQQHRALAQARAAAPGPVEIGFAQSMALHHQQAIGMAQLLLDGRPTRLGLLARSIAYSQLLELGQMQGWLLLWDQPLVQERRSMDWMRMGALPLDPELTQYLLDCSRAPTGMSGLATDAEVNRLRQLEGQERDRHFLQLMLAHHQGAVPMARFAAKSARLPAVRILAGQIVLDQSEEIARIQHMLQLLDTLQPQAAASAPVQPSSSQKVAP